jgi:hypothetical protein
MDRTTQTSSQVLGNLVIGGLYVPERHNDEIERYLPRPDERSFAVGFDQVLKSLRAALSLR